VNVTEGQVGSLARDSPVLPRFRRTSRRSSRLYTVPPPLCLFTLLCYIMSSHSSRRRSNSIVKVEEIGLNTESDMLDQSVYPNVNVEWVNQKGELCTVIALMMYSNRCSRCLDYSPHLNSGWKVHPGYNSWGLTANELDYDEPSIHLRTLSCPSHRY
jgi:hypothetical protein